MANTKRKTLVGLPILDATEPLDITITDIDIRRATVKKPSCCAAAQAVMRQTGCLDVRIHLSRVYVRYNKHWLRYLTPSSLRDQIITFDKKIQFKPGYYTLLVLQATIRARTKNEYAGYTKGSKLVPSRGRKSPRVDDIRPSALSELRG